MVKLSTALNKSVRRAVPAGLACSVQRVSQAAGGIFVCQFKNSSRKEERMFFTLTRPTLRLCPALGIGRTAVHAVIAVLLLSTPRVVSAQAEADFETPPVLNVKDLVAENLLQGKGYHVEEKVPTDGIMGDRKSTRLNSS